MKNRIILMVALLLPVFSFAQSVNKSPSNFSGVWEYRGSTELAGHSYSVQQRYTLYQRGRRVCGCLERAGAPNAMVEQYAISGEAHRDYVDLWMDAGTPRSASYSPHYPFEPDDLVRLKKSAKTLMIGAVRQEANKRSFVFPAEDHIIYITNMPLRLSPAAANSDVCDSEEEGATRIFMEACLSDQRKRQRDAVLRSLSLSGS